MSHSDRIRIRIDHPNAINVEGFLNSWSEPFVPEGAGGDEFTFRSAVSQLRVAIRFFDSQQEGFKYGEKHFGSFIEGHLWGMNGGFLYSVRGADKGLVAELASHFAGRE